jgi:hypothetical protein
MVRAAAVGIAIGVAYTLSPLFVMSMLGFGLVLQWAGRHTGPSERRWVLALLVAAMAMRLAAIGLLFLSTDHEMTPFGRLFGDEEYFIRRGIWLANLALGIPISLADVKYAYDDSIQTSLVYLLASLNVVFGPAQYGVRVVSALIYLAGAVALYRAVRPSFGKPASLIALTLLLFLPSLFVWSISVLKEPVFFAVMAGVVALTIAAGRASWPLRVAAIVVIAAAAIGAETIRDGGLVVAGVGTALGVAAAFCGTRPRLLLAAAVVTMAVGSVALMNGRIQDRVTAAMAQAARRHWDNAKAAGHSYTIFPPPFYHEAPLAGRMSLRDRVTLVIGGVWAYAVVPTPWEMQSRTELAYLPEQMIWYGMVLLLPIGVVAGWRRDPFVTSVLAAHLVVAVVLVALTSGNVGTLVRHRALAMPYVVWFSGLGVGVVLAWLAGFGQPVAARIHGQEAGA